MARLENGILWNTANLPTLAIQFKVSLRGEGYEKLGRGTCRTWHIGIDQSLRDKEETPEGRRADM